MHYVFVVRVGDETEAPLNEYLIVDGGKAPFGMPSWAAPRMSNKDGIRTRSGLNINRQPAGSCLGMPTRPYTGLALDY